MKPLTMTNSPWAKFTTSVALKMRTKPRAISAYTQPVASPLTTWLARISTMFHYRRVQAFADRSRRPKAVGEKGRCPRRTSRTPRAAATESHLRRRTFPTGRLLASAFLQFQPLAHLRPLAVLHDDQSGGAAHPTASVAAVAVLEPPARVPVLDGFDRLEQRVACEVPAGALQGFHEEGGLLVAVQVRGVERQVREILLHVGPVEIQEGAGLRGQRIHLHPHDPLDVLASQLDGLVQHDRRGADEQGFVADGVALLGQPRRLAIHRLQDDRLGPGLLELGRLRAEVDVGPLVVDLRDVREIVVLEPGLSAEVPVEAVLVVLVEAGDLPDLPVLHQVVDDQPRLIHIGGQIADVPFPGGGPQAGEGGREDVGDLLLLEIVLDRLRRRRPGGPSWRTPCRARRVASRW